MKEPRELQQLVADADIGKPLEIVIFRDNARQTLKVPVGEMPAS